jgi:hypothetical protein
MTERNRETLTPAGGKVMVSMEDAAMIRKVHKILAAGKNVEIRNDKDGKPKVLKVSKEIA